MLRFFQHKRSIATLAGCLLLSVSFLTQAHYHDQLFEDTACAICLSQVNLAADLNSTAQSDFYIGALLQFEQQPETVPFIALLGHCARAPPVSFIV